MGFGRHFRGFRGGFGHGDEDHHHGGRRHWGHGRGMGRPFDHGELKLVILAMLAERPSHGYEIIKAIEEHFGGSYTPSPGVVYPTLTMLEELGCATVEETAGKKQYTVTEAGRAYLAQNQAAADAAMNRMQQIGSERGGGPSPQLIRAMENFKLALRLRMRKGPLTEERIREIVAAIDAAVAVVERS